MEFAVRSALGAEPAAADRSSWSSRRCSSRPRPARVGAALACGRLHAWSRARCRSARGRSRAALDWTRLRVGDGHRRRRRRCSSSLVPAVALWRGDLRGVLGRARTGGIDGRGGRLENGLVVAEVALAVLVAAGAALLARSVANLYAVDPGRRAPRASPSWTSMLGGGLHDARSDADARRADGGAGASCPACARSASAQKLPLRGGGYKLRHHASRDVRTSTATTTEFRIVTPGYLESMGIALRAGPHASTARRPARDASASS